MTSRLSLGSTAKEAATRRWPHKKQDSDLDESEIGLGQIEARNSIKVND